MGVDIGPCGHHYLTISSWCPECFCSSPFLMLSKCSPFDPGPTACLEGQGEEKQKYGGDMEQLFLRWELPRRTS